MCHMHRFDANFNGTFDICRKSTIVAVTQNICQKQKKNQKQPNWFAI